MPMPQITGMSEGPGGEIMLPGPGVACAAKDAAYVYVAAFLTCLLRYVRLTKEERII